MEVDTMDAILAQNKAMAQQLITLNKKMEKLKVATIGTQAETTSTCGLCGGPHENHQCYLIKEAQPMEQINYMGNQPRQPFHDPNANTYNPGWRNHPNLAALEKLTLKTSEFVQTTNNFIEQISEIKIPPVGIWKLKWVKLLSNSQLHCLRLFLVTLK
ncbi:hypothetical protein PIB30_077947 [Stylosanthes scabra]|uniref:Retrotransposon gag protein n=1 Tax=Stylosanthes scabra TaxID=79078 RepID=A0ABU6ZPE0_9FABA|nr:hypothetical protein [Stylosanthes scabra]